METNINRRTASTIQKLGSPLARTEKIFGLAFTAPNYVKSIVLKITNLNLRANKRNLSQLCKRTHLILKM